MLVIIKSPQSANKHELEIGKASYVTIVRTTMNGIKEIDKIPGR